jgi:hypothetical protein
MSADQAGKPSQAVLWTGRILSALVVLALLLGSAMSITKQKQAVEGLVKHGLSESVVVPLGIVSLACAVLYAIPFTSVLGAILITGYMGGAVYAHLWVGEPLYAPIIFGVVVWAGLFLRFPDLRKMIPFRL